MARKVNIGVTTASPRAAVIVTPCFFFIRGQWWGFWGLNELIQTKRSEHCLAHSERSINVRWILFIFNWRIVALQCCFRYTAKWFMCVCVCVFFFQILFLYKCFGFVCSSFWSSLDFYWQHIDKCSLVCCWVVFFLDSFPLWIIIRYWI